MYLDRYGFRHYTVQEGFNVSTASNLFCYAVIGTLTRLIALGFLFIADWKAIS